MTYVNILWRPLLSFTQEHNTFIKSLKNSIFINYGSIFVHHNFDKRFSWKIFEAWNKDRQYGVMYPHNVFKFPGVCVNFDIDVLVQERRNSIANSLELCLSCANLRILPILALKYI